MTKVYPASMNVLFESFIRVERLEPSDIDFENQRREEVMHGRHHAAITEVVTSCRTKPPCAKWARPWGFPIELVDRLSSTAYGIGGQWICGACLRDIVRGPKGLEQGLPVRFRRPNSLLPRVCLSTQTGIDGACSSSVRRRSSNALSAVSSIKVTSSGFNSGWSGVPWRKWSSFSQAAIHSRAATR